MVKILKHWGVHETFGFIITLLSVKYEILKIIKSQELEFTRQHLKTMAGKGRQNEKASYEAAQGAWDSD